MKNTLLLLALLRPFFVSAKLIGYEIDEGSGVFGLDSFSFEQKCDFLEVDANSGNIWQVGESLKPFSDSIQGNFLPGKSH